MQRSTKASTGSCAAVFFLRSRIGSALPGGTGPPLSGDDLVSLAETGEAGAYSSPALAVGATTSISPVSTS
jgi:hypothetical protein